PREPLTTAATAVDESAERARAENTSAAARRIAATPKKLRTRTRRVCQTVPSLRPPFATDRRSVAEAAIIAEGLQKSYGKVHALRGVDLRAEQGTRARPARAQRRRQDDRRPHPHHAARGRRRDGPRRRARREGRREGTARPHRPRRPVRGRRREPDR